jgi:hypothetical protein
VRRIQAAFLAVLAVELTAVVSTAQPPDDAASSSVAQEQQSNTDQPPIDNRSDPSSSASTAESEPGRLAPPEDTGHQLPHVTSAEHTQEVWYGWQNVLSDVASVGLIAASGSSSAAPLAYVGLLGYIGGSPVIHAVNGSGQKSAISVGLRLGLPLVGGLMAYAITSSHSQSSEDNDLGNALEIAGGVAAGAIVAMVIDDIFVARKTKPITVDGHLPRNRWHLSPIVSKDIRGISIGLEL